jgi:hypothetical protein
VDIFERKEMLYVHNFLFLMVCHYDLVLFVVHTNHILVHTLGNIAISIL